MKTITINQFFITLLLLIGLSSLTNAQVSMQVGSTPNQTMRYGMDYERLWYWTNSLNSAEKDLVSQWSVVDNDIDFIRVAINCGYELTEGTYNLSAYTNKIIPMMQDMKDANPDIKFFASPRPLDEATNNVAWQPYPQWITGSVGSGSSFSFDWEKCAEYLVRYIKLMDSYGFEISYLDITNEWNYVSPYHTREIADYLETDLTSNGLPMPKIIAPSTWSYSQGTSWLNGAVLTSYKDAIDISASHNTDPGGSAEAFAQKSHDILGTDKEIWNTEVHDWKSTGGYDEVLTFSYMMEAINAGFSGLTGWLAIGTTNQGHCYILNPSGTPSRNVKYYIFNKLTNTSHRGQALDIETPAGLSHTTALIKDNLLTVWAVNPNSTDLDVSIDLSSDTYTNQQITRTYWNTGTALEGVIDTYTSTSLTSVNGTVPAGSLVCFEIVLSSLSSSFVPDPSKKYYIDVPVHDLRLAATGESEDAYTTSTSTAGADVEWQFVDKGNGSWHVQLAAGGSTPRLRTRNNGGESDMQSTSSSGSWTYWDFAPGSSTGTYFFTLPDGPGSLTRLQVDNSGGINMVPETYSGSWESFSITEVETSTLVHITKRNATGFALEGGTSGLDGEDIYLWSSDQTNQDQQWIEIDRGNGYYSYQKTGTNFCMDGGNGGTNEQDLYLWTCGDNNQNQHWEKVSTDDGAFKLIKRNADFAINGGSGGSDGQGATIYNSSSSHHNLQWYITPIGTATPKNFEISQAIIDDNFVIYPNPVESVIRIQGANNSIVQLYDVNGRLLFSKLISTENETLDLSHLQTGIYFLKTNDPRIEAKKIIKN